MKLLLFFLLSLFFFYPVQAGPLDREQAVTCVALYLYFDPDTSDPASLYETFSGSTMTPLIYRDILDTVSMISTAYSTKPSLFTGFYQDCKDGAAKINQ
ncbi:MAG: hypothetical protein ACXWVS_12415 [Hyphomicrobium sp.]